MLSIRGLPKQHDCTDTLATQNIPANQNVPTNQNVPGTSLAPLVCCSPDKHCKIANGSEKTFVRNCYFY